MTITKTELSPWDYVIFTACLTISAGIGVFYRFAGGRQSTTEEFLMADRRMASFPVALSLLASFISAITLLGSASEVFVNGTQIVLMCLTNFVTIPIAVYLYLPVFYRLKLTSAYEYLEIRFDKTTRTLTNLLFILQMMIYMGIVLYSPCLALSASTGVNLWLLIACTGAVCIFYTTLGGIKAVMWTDAFQVGIMFLGIVCVLGLGSAATPGGFSGAWQIAESRGRIEFDNLRLDPFERHSVWNLFVGGCGFWLAVYAVNQAQVQRCLSCPSLRRAQIAMWINAPGNVAFAVLSASLGILVFARYADCDPLSAGFLSASDQLLPLYVMDVMSPYAGLAGLFISCVFCGSLSTISSGLNSLAAVILQDIVRAYFRPNLPDVVATRVSKIVVVVLGVVVMALTWIPSRMEGVMVAALAFNGALAGPLLGVFTLGLFVPMANATGATSGFVVATLFIIWVVVGSQIYKPPKTLLCASTIHCGDFEGVINFNASLVERISCDRPRVPPNVEGYEGLAIYRISYMWYVPISCLVVVVVAVAVTLAGGRRRWASPDAHLLSPVVGRFLRNAETKDQNGKKAGNTNEAVETEEEGYENTSVV